MVPLWNLIFTSDIIYMYIWVRFSPEFEVNESVSRACTYGAAQPGLLQISVNPSSSSSSSSSPLLSSSFSLLSPPLRVFFFTPPPFSSFLLFPLYILFDFAQWFVCLILEESHAKLSIQCMQQLINQTHSHLKKRALSLLHAYTVQEQSCYIAHHTDKKEETKRKKETNTHHI